MASAEGDWQVRRVIRLPGLATAGQAAGMEQLLRDQPGVVTAVAVPGRSRVEVEYLITQTDYQSLLQCLREAGYRLPGDWWSRLRAGWYQNLDLNGRDNARQSPAACCNKPPPRPRR